MDNNIDACAQGGRAVNRASFGTALDLSGPIIDFSGNLDALTVDDGGVYSGLPVGTPFSGLIDDVSANGAITDETTLITFGCCIAAGGLSLDNDLVLSADKATLLNHLLGYPRFNHGDLVEGIDIEGDKTTLDAGRIEVGLCYIFDPGAFSDSNPGSYPFNPNDALLELFFIVEEDAVATEIYSVFGKIHSIETTFLAPGWSTADFHTVCTTPAKCAPTRAIEFHSLGNLYIEDTTDDESGQIDILKPEASSGYITSPVLASYGTTHKGVTGLDFDDPGRLCVSERSTDGDAGIIRKIDVPTRTLGRLVSMPMPRAMFSTAAERKPAGHGVNSSRMTRHWFVLKQVLIRSPQALLWIALATSLFRRQQGPICLC